MNHSSNKLVKMSLLATGLIIAVSVLWTFASEANQYGFRVSPSEANAVLFQNFEIPDTSRNINFHTTPWYTIITMDIDEPKFLSWCSKKNWKVKQVVSDRPASLVVLNEQSKSTTLQIVLNGYRFNEMEGDTGFQGTFDAALNKASITYSNR